MLIPANSAVKFPEELALNSGQSIIGNADGTGVLVLASGLLKT